MATLGLDSTDFEKGIRGASNTANNFGGILGKIAGAGLALMAIERAFQGISNAIENSIGKAADFQTAMAHIAGLTNTSGDAIAGLSKQVLQMASSMGQSPQKLAEALYFISSSGFEGADAMNILNESAKASAAGLGSTAKVADALTSAISAYKVGTDQAAHFTDVLTQSVIEGKGEADSFAGVFGRVLPIASQMGVSIEEVAASLATMTRTGLSTDEAATALRQLLMNLVRPAKQSAEALSAMGISSDQLRQMIKDKGLLATLDVLMDKTGGNVDQLGKIVPNIRGLVAVLGTAGSQGEAYAEVLRNIENSTGATDKAFAKVKETFNFNWDALKAGAESFTIALVAGLLPGLTDVVTLLRKMVDAALPLGFALGKTISIIVEQFERLVKAIASSKEAIAVALIALSPILLPVFLTIVGAIGTVVGALAGLVASALVAAAPFILLGLVVVGLLKAFGVFDDIVALVMKLPDAAKIAARAIQDLAKAMGGNTDALFGPWHMLDSIFGKTGADKITQGISAMILGIRGFFKALSTGKDDALIPFAVALTNLGFSEGTAQSITAGVSKVIDVIQGMVDWIKENGPKIADAIMQAVGWVWDNIAPKVVAFGTTVMSILGTLISWIQENWPTVQNALVNAWDYIAPKAQVAFTAVMTGISTVIAFVQENWPAVQEALVNAWDYIAPKAQAAFDLIMVGIQNFIAFVQENWPAIQEALVNAWDYIAPKAQAAFDTIMTGIQNFIGFVQENWPAVQDALVNAWDYIAPKAQAAFDTIMGGVQNFIGFVQENWPTVQDALVTAWDTIAPKAQEAFDKVTEVISTVIDFIGSNWPAIKDTLVGAWDAVKPAVQDVIEFIMQLVKQVVDAVQEDWPIIQEIAGKVWDQVSEKVSEFADKAKEAWQSFTELIGPTLKAAVVIAIGIFEMLKVAWEAVGPGLIAATKDAWEAIKTVISNVLQVVLNVIKMALQVLNGDWKGAWDTLQENVSLTWDTIKTIVGAAIKILADIIDSLTGNMFHLRDAVDIAGAAWGAFETAVRGAYDIGVKILGVIKDIINFLAKPLSLHIDWPSPPAWLDKITPGSPVPLAVGIDAVNDAARNATPSIQKMWDAFEPVSDLPDFIDEVDNKMGVLGDTVAYTFKDVEDTLKSLSTSSDLTKGIHDLTMSMKPLKVEVNDLNDQIKETQRGARDVGREAAGISAQAANIRTQAEEMGRAIRAAGGDAQNNAGIMALQSQASALDEQSRALRDNERSIRDRIDALSEQRDAIKSDIDDQNNLMKAYKQYQDALNEVINLQMQLPGVAEEIASTQGLQADSVERLIDKYGAGADNAGVFGSALRDLNVMLVDVNSNAIPASTAIGAMNKALSEGTQEGAKLASQSTAIQAMIAQFKALTSASDPTQVDELIRRLQVLGQMTGVPPEVIQSLVDLAKSAEANKQIGEAAQARLREIKDTVNGLEEQIHAEERVQHAQDLGKQTIEAQKKALEDRRKELQENSKLHEAEINAIDKQIAAVQKQIDQQNTLTQGSKNNVTALNDRIKALKDEKDQIQGSNDLLAKANDLLDPYASRINNTASANELFAKALAQQVTAMNQSLPTYQELIASIQALGESIGGGKFMSNLDLARQRLGLATQDLSNLAEELGLTKEQIDGAGNVLDLFTQKVQENQGSIDTYNIWIADAEARIAAFSDQLANSTDLTDDQRAALEGQIGVMQGNIAIWQSMADKVGNANTAAQTFIGSANTVSGGADGLATAVSGAGGAAVQAANGFGQFSTALQTNFDSITSLADQAKEAGHYIGFSIVEGMAEGISDGSSILIDTIVEVVQMAIAAAKVAAGIHSPSSLANEQIGQPISLGIAQGINEAAPQIFKVITRTLQTTMSQAEEVAAGLIKVVKGNDGLDYAIPIDYVTSWPGNTVGSQGTTTVGYNGVSSMITGRDPSPSTPASAPAVTINAPQSDPYAIVRELDRWAWRSSITSGLKA
jgi:TP901 family phage tail tape measure protein